jgi:hypothetical protein
VTISVQRQSAALGFPGSDVTPNDYHFTTTLGAKLRVLNRPTALKELDDRPIYAYRLTYERHTIGGEPDATV